MNICGRDGTVLALVIPQQGISPGIRFFTDPTASMQVGVMRRSRGYEVKPHSHLQYERKIIGTNEVLFIFSGMVRVSIYELDGTLVQAQVLTGGDMVIFQGGGHGIEVLGESIIWEVKQGPYLGKEDKVYHDA